MADCYLPSPYHQNEVTSRYLSHFVLLEYGYTDAPLYFKKRLEHRSNPYLATSSAQFLGYSSNVVEKLSHPQIAFHWFLVTGSFFVDMKQAEGS